MKTRVPPWAIVTAALALGALILFRRRQAAQASDFAAATFPIAPIPASFSYLTDAAKAPTGTIPAPGIDAASLGLLTQLTNALISNATLIAGQVPRSIGVSSSTIDPHHDKQGLGGFVDPNDFARGFGVAGYTTAQLIAIARTQAPSYGGQKYAPHNLAEEAQVKTDSAGHHYIRVKFADPRGIMANSTENVYLPK